MASDSSGVIGVICIESVRLSLNVIVVLESAQYFTLCNKVRPFKRGRGSSGRTSR